MLFPVNISTVKIMTPMINFYYPMVTGMSNFLLQQKINCKIFNFTKKFILDLKYLDMPTYITGSYEIKTNERGVLSFILSGLGDFKGAHPVNSVKSLNLNIETGKVYKFNELFKKDSDYIKIISMIGEREFKKQYTDLLNYEKYKGVKPNQDYFLCGSNLMIYFQQYELGPRPLGFPYFSVPSYEIENIIDEKSILGIVNPAIP
ncbi:RsiV family protein [Haloimpatiens sp. FM7330]|uniref:RsiV family protein n=1 Tax=Haloimpatiens sp. FM7330 TaxID=3298610 RepID=UPI003640788D